MMHHVERDPDMYTECAVCVCVCIYSGHDDVRAHRTIH